MINYIQGDITTVTKGLIGHGVNAQGVMGSGVALAIRNKWPMVYDYYKSLSKQQMKLGTVQIVDINDEIKIANIFSQEFFGSDGIKYASADAIKIGLQYCFEYCFLFDIDVFSLPKIGCGLGGLIWEEDVLPILEELHLKYNDININIFYKD